MHSIERSSVAVLGVPFDNVTMDEAVDWMEQTINQRGFHQVATANVDFLMHAIRDKELQAILCSCDMVVPDGMPILWAARLMGVQLKERVSGVDLVPRLAQLSAARGYGIYLLGAEDQIARRAAESLKERFPGVRIVGRYSPPVGPLEDMDHEGILRRIERTRPDILLVAMGNPKQEKWLAMHRDRLRVPICMGVGGTLDLLAGALSRAPKWMQNSGLEWLHRTSQEPGRLAKRYLNDAAGLALHLPPQVALSVAQPRKPVQSALQAYDTGTSLVLVVSGDVNSGILRQFERLMEQVRQDNRHVVLDLSNTAYLGADSLGALLRQATLMKRQHLQLWLACLPAHIRRVLRSARIEHFFPISPSIADAAYRIAKTERMLPPELAAVRSLSPEVRNRASIQMEILQELCERMSAVSENAEFDLAGFRTRASAGH